MRVRRVPATEIRPATGIRAPGAGSATGAFTESVNGRPLGCVLGDRPTATFVRADTVHVTQLEGEASVADRLLEEPLRFAEREGMAVELLAPEGETETREAAERAGFEHAGPGPTFEGESTVRYRLDPR